MEPRAEPACPAAKPRARGQETIMKRTRQFPTVATAPSVQRQRLSGNRPTIGNIPATGPISQTNITLPFTVEYEVDLFGRRRRSIEAAQASYQANAADLENLRLVITAE